MGIGQFADYRYHHPIESGRVGNHTPHTRATRAILQYYQISLFWNVVLPRQRYSFLEIDRNEVI